MATNGIGSMVRSLVHERNATRFATNDRAASAAQDARLKHVPGGDGDADAVEMSAEAMARLELWKTRHGLGTTDPAGAPPKPAAEPIPVVGGGLPKPEAQPLPVWGGGIPNPVAEVLPGGPSATPRPVAESLPVSGILPGTH